MPVNFLTAVQRERFGRYAAAPSPEDLARFFHLTEDDKALIANRRRDHSRLGFAVQLGTVRYLGTFLEDQTKVPASVLETMGCQLGISNLGCIQEYQAGEQRWIHASEIKAKFGYRDFTDPTYGLRLSRWLYSLCWTGTDRPSMLFNRAADWLLAHKVLLPGVSVLERFVARVRSRVESRLYRLLEKGVSTEQQALLDDLLTVPESSRTSRLDQLRSGPSTVSGPSLVRALHRLQIIRSLGISLPAVARIPPSRIASPGAGPVLAALAEELDQTYGAVAARLPANPAVRFELENGRKELVLTPLDKLEEPPSLLALRKAVGARLPRVDLPEILLEVAARTNFIEAFTHVSESAARATNLGLSLCAILLAEACNTGLEPLVLNDVPALRRDRLSWVSQNYIRDETLTIANARLVAFQNRIALAHAWGGGEVASADGLRFVVPVRTVHAGPNPKYFGTGRGVTHYNLVSNQFTGLNAITVPGTMRDSLILLAVVLEQQTDLQPSQIMTDTGAYSDVVFGLFRLLGYRFSPRLADIGGTRFWRIDPQADYGELNAIARQRINLDLIARHWDDLLRLTGSLKLGRVPAAGIMRTLQVGDRPTRLAQALGEFGRIDKTLHSLTYLDNEDKRRNTLLQLNRGEGRHALARAVFHGKRGELRQRYREGQEDQLSALGLVVNVIVLWNTLYMDATLLQLRQEGFLVRGEDVARLSPLIYDHINMLGRYSFAVPEAVSRGELRPLRDPTVDD